MTSCHIMNIKNKETEESKMKIKKVLSLLMCILILFGTVMAFNACSKKSPEEETVEAEVETTESYETKARQAVFKKAENWYWSHTIGG